MNDSAADQFELLLSQFVTRPDVTPPDPTKRSFGADSLRVNGKIFALVPNIGRLTFKLPHEVVDAYVADGQGQHWDANKGTPMKEWFVLGPDSTLDPVELAERAYAFVRGPVAH